MYVTMRVIGVVHLPIITYIPSSRHTTAAELSLAGNSFTGTIDTTVGLMANLGEFLEPAHFGSHALSTAFPYSVHALMILLLNCTVDLNMGNNQLEGPIPSEVGSLVRLGKCL